LGCYGNEAIKSPNIDKLASEGILFNRAYCQEPICMSSRASLLSGLRPDTLRIFSNKSLDELAPGALTINQHFESNGYQIWAAGKIYHHGIDVQKQWGDKRVIPSLATMGRGYLSEKSIKIVEEYDANEIEMADNPYMPENASSYFEYNFGELRNYAGIPKEEAFDESLSRDLKHGYYACVSYVDAQVGRLLEGLKQHGLDQNTIIILWGDHGWKLGEHGMWCKHTQFELDSHVPLMVKVPGQEHTDSKTNAIVEFVDIYPTLCELAGLELPDHLQGTSFVPVIDDPEMEWKKGAFTVWPRNYNDPEKLVMGHCIQTERYRYTEWIKESTGEVMARDLFDHEADPDENVNISNYPENGTLINELSELLEKGKGWRTIHEELKIL
jgi:arylsulfatase A-like enzyme